MSMWCYRVGPEVLIGLTTVMLRYVMALKYALNRFSMLFSKPGRGPKFVPNSLCVSAPGLEFQDFRCLSAPAS